MLRLLKKNSSRCTIPLVVPYQSTCNVRMSSTVCWNVGNKYYYPSSMDHHHHPMNTRMGIIPRQQQQQQLQQYRSYVFLPSSFSEWMQSIRSTVTTTSSSSSIHHNNNNNNSSSSRSGKKVVLSVRLRNRRDQMKQQWLVLKKEWLKHMLMEKNKTKQKWKDDIKEMKLKLQELRLSQTQKKKRLVLKTSSWIRTILFQIKQLPKTTTTTATTTNNSNSQSLYYSKYNIFLSPASNPDWFDKTTGYPLTSKDYVTDRYVNPWDNTPHVNGQIFTFPEFLSWRFQRLWRRFPTTLSSLSPSYNNNTTPSSSSSSSSSLESTTNTDTLSSSSLSFQYEPPDCTKQVKLTWLGHSSTLVEMHGLTILTDPHFSTRAGTTARYSSCPISNVDTDLPSTIDFCILSHDHYDHLDYDTIQQLQHKVQYFVVPMGLKSWLLNDKFYNQIPSHRIIELEWWQSVVLPYNNNNNNKNNSSNNNNNNNINDDDDDDKNNHHNFHYPPSFLGLQDLPLNPNKITINNNNNNNNNIALQPHLDDDDDNNNNNTTNDVSNEMDKVVITCTPAQHYCSRTPFDRNRRLWCSFAITSFCYQHNHMEEDDNDDDDEQSLVGSDDDDDDNDEIIMPHKLSFYFAGDTGMPTEFPLFRQIGDALGPFDLAAIPIGAYLPKDYLKQSHCSPDEAVQIHHDIRSKKSVGIHWGTFDLADEDYTEPPRLLQKHTTIFQQQTNEFIDFTTIPQGHYIQSSLHHHHNNNEDDDVQLIKKKSNVMVVPKDDDDDTNDNNDIHKVLTTLPTTTMMDVSLDNKDHPVVPHNLIMSNPEDVDIVEVDDDDAIIALSVVDSLEELVTENDDVLTLLENETFDDDDDDDGNHYSEENKDMDYDDDDDEPQQQQQHQQAL